MAKSSKSYPDNQKDVYKFWLGFFEKVTLILVTVVILPRIVGQIKYPPLVLVIAIAIILIFCAAMLILGRRIWYLPKEDKK